MTKIATVDWFEGWGTSVFSENTAIFLSASISSRSSFSFHLKVALAGSLTFQHHINSCTAGAHVHDYESFDFLCAHFSCSLSLGRG